ncbi:MAG: PKD domain-containing protein [Ignavibacteria bacterium]|nr:PKD domain-containing protein [Ignavibacteria bacterium]
MKYLILLLSLLSFTALHAQNGWKDMGGYKETMETTGEVLQIKPTTDGKYLYVLCNLMDSTVKKTAIQKWDVDSGRIVFSRFINRVAYSAVRVNLNCDAATYSMYAVAASGGTKYLLVKQLDTDSLLLSRIDNDNMSVAQIDYDTVTHSFYIAYLNDYYQSNGPEFFTYSNGFISKKTVTQDGIVGVPIIAPNTVRFNHTLGTSIVAAVNYYRYTSNKSFGSSNNNQINYIGNWGKSMNLETYSISDNQDNTNCLALSENGLTIAASSTEYRNFSTWYVDSALHPILLQTYPMYTNSLTFSSDNKYVLANSPSDSSIYTINVALRTICGRVQSPFIQKTTQIASIPTTNSILAICLDKKIRRMDAIKDSIQQTYSIEASKTSIYQHDTIAFCPVIPAFDNESIAWDFGDGSTSSSITPWHTYDSAGFFDVKLTISDSLGTHEVLLKKLIEVKPTPVPNTLDFDADITFGSAPLTVKFKNLSTGTIVSYKWDYGDGSSSTARDTTHTFSKQQFYTITLTINNGIKDTSLTKFHYVNADTYPSFSLKTKLLTSMMGSKTTFASEIHDRSEVFENMVRTPSGKVFVNNISYEDDYGISYVSGMSYHWCNARASVYRIDSEGADVRFTKAPSTMWPILLSGCDIGTGVLGSLNNNAISFFTRIYFPYNYTSATYILNANDDTSAIRLDTLPFFTMDYNVRALSNNIDCYSFRDDRGHTSPMSYLCFYKDTKQLLKKDNIKGYALPAVETADGRFMSVVSPISNDTTINRRIQLRWYSSTGTFLDSAYITRPTSDFILDISPLTDN